MCHCFPNSFEALYSLWTSVVHVYVWSLCVAGTDSDSRRHVSSGTLILTDVQYSDTAVYQCEATNKHGNILVNTRVHVVGEHHLIQCPSAICMCSLHAGERLGTLSLQCEYGFVFKNEWIHADSTWKT